MVTISARVGVTIRVIEHSLCTLRSSRVKANGIRIRFRIRVTGWIWVRVRVMVGSGLGLDMFFYTNSIRVRDQIRVMARVRCVRLPRTGSLGIEHGKDKLWPWLA